jgi:hypothetical protein
VDLKTALFKVPDELPLVRQFLQTVALDSMLLNKAGHQAKMKATMPVICMIIHLWFVLIDKQLLCFTGWLGYLAHAPTSRCMHLIRSACMLLDVLVGNLANLYFRTRFATDMPHQLFNHLYGAMLGASIPSLSFF